MLRAVEGQFVGRPEAEWGSRRSLCALASVTAALAAAAVTMTLLNRFRVIATPPMKVSIGLSAGLGALALGLTSASCARHRAALGRLEFRRGSQSDSPSADSPTADDSRVELAQQIATLNGVKPKGQGIQFYDQLRENYRARANGEVLRAIRLMEGVLNLDPYEPKAETSRSQAASAVAKAVRSTESQSSDSPGLRAVASPMQLPAPAHPTITPVSPVLSSPASDRSAASPGVSPAQMHRASSAPVDPQVPSPAG